MSDLDDIADNLAAQIRAHAVELLGDESFSHSIWKAIKLRLPAHHAGPPRLTAAAAGEGNGRWMARLLMFNQHGDLVADSQPGDDPIDAEPTELMPTIRAVGAWVRESAEGYHAEAKDPPPLGLDEPTLDKRILSLRVQLSRTKTNFVWWKLPYTVGDQRWQVNVRVGKATAAEIAAGPLPAVQPFRSATPPEHPPETFPGAQQE